MMPVPLICNKNDDRGWQTHVIPARVMVLLIRYIYIYEEFKFKKECKCLILLGNP